MKWSCGTDGPWQWGDRPFVRMINSQVRKEAANLSHRHPRRLLHVRSVDAPQESSLKRRCINLTPIWERLGASATEPPRTGVWYFREGRRFSR